MVEKWFGNVPKGDVPPRNLPQEPQQTAAVRRTVEAAVPLDALYLAFHVPARIDPDYYALDLMTDILAGGASSRFYQKLVKQDRIFTELDCYQTGYLDPGLVVIEGKPTEGVTLEAAEVAIWAELAVLKGEPIADVELQKLKNRAESQQAFGDVGAANKAMNLAFYELIGDANLINTEIDRYNAVEIKDIQRVANNIFRTDNSTLLFYKAKRNL